MFVLQEMKQPPVVNLTWPSIAFLVNAPFQKSAQVAPIVQELIFVMVRYAQPALRVIAIVVVHAMTECVLLMSAPQQMKEPLVQTQISLNTVSTDNVQILKLAQYIQIVDELISAKVAFVKTVLKVIVTQITVANLPVFA